MTDKITIDRAVVEQALACLVRAEIMYGQPTGIAQDSFRAALDQPALAQRTPIRFNDAPEHIYLQVCDLDEDECNKPFSAHEEVCWSSESHHESDVLYVREDKAQRPAVPPGYRLVPVEPTPEMKDVQTWDYGAFRPASEIWADMLNAAPEAPAAQKEQP